MNPRSTRRVLKSLLPKLPIASVLSFVFILLALSGAGWAQGSQLTLADILIGLRSKKATLPERNQILTDAVVTRGTTFVITPEIEKELATTGADKALIDAIKKKGACKDRFRQPAAGRSEKGRIATAGFFFL